MGERTSESLCPGGKLGKQAAGYRSAIFFGGELLGDVSLIFRISEERSKSWQLELWDV